MWEKVLGDVQVSESSTLQRLKAAEGAGFAEGICKWLDTVYKKQKLLELLEVFGWILQVLFGGRLSQWFAQFRSRLEGGGGLGGARPRRMRLRGQVRSNSIERRNIQSSAYLGAFKDFF